VFTLYALDQELGLARPTHTELAAAMAGHILRESHLTGTFQKAPAQKAPAQKAPANR